MTNAARSPPLVGQADAMQELVALLG